MGLGWVPAFKNQRETFGKIFKSINDIYSHLNVEIKQHDYTSQGSISTTAVFYPLTDIDVGVTGGSNTGLDIGYRGGDKIRMKTCHIKGHVQNDLTNTATIWIYLIKHYENMNNVGVVFDDIWDATSAHGSGIRGIQLRNRDHVRQYKLLERRQIRLSGIEDKDNEHYFNMYHVFRQRAGSYVEFEGGDGAADPSNGKLYMMVVGSDVNSIDLEFSSRVTYIDN